MASYNPGQGFSLSSSFGSRAAPTGGHQRVMVGKIGKPILALMFHPRIEAGVQSININYINSGNIDSFGNGKGVRDI